MITKYIQKLVKQFSVDRNFVATSLLSVCSEVTRTQWLPAFTILAGHKAIRHP